MVSSQRLAHDERHDERAGAGLAAASLTVAGVGIVGALVMAFVVRETLGANHAQS
jgi:hypothetical protein